MLCINQPSGMKNGKVVHLQPPGYILSILLYVYCILGGYNSYSTEYIKLKFQAFLKFVETDINVQFQIPRYEGFKFRNMISSISQLLCNNSLFGGQL